MRSCRLLADSDLPTLADWCSEGTRNFKYINFTVVNIEVSLVKILSLIFFIY